MRFLGDISGTWLILVLDKLELRNVPFVKLLKQLDQPPNTYSHAGKQCRLLQCIA